MTVSRRTRLAVTATAVALAGCASGAPTGPPEGRVSGAAPVSNNGGALADNGSLDGPISNPAKPAQAGAPAKPADPGQPKPVDVAVGRTDDGVPAEAALAAPQTAWRDAALASATTARIAAATGAVVATPDGKLTLTIPPGALTADADVRVAPMDTSAMPLPNVYAPAMRFALDLGGAAIAPGATIRVKQPVDPRFVPALQQRLGDGFRAEAYGLTQDAAGAYYLEMPVRGPDAKTPLVPMGGSGTWGQILLAELGHLPFAPGPANAKAAYALQATPQEQFEATYGKPAPTSMKEWFAYEQGGVFDCGTIESTCWGVDLLAGLGFPISRPGSCGPSPAVPTIPFMAGPIAAKVAYTSDDPAVDGKPAAGATVTFSMLQTAFNGPTQVVADADGKAASFTAAGSLVRAMAQIDVGPRSGAWGQGMVGDPAPIALAVEKNSPHLDLDLDADVPLGALIAIQYQVDGAEATATLQIPHPQAMRDQVRLVAHMPDDAAHAFKVTGVGGGQVTLLEATPGELSVRRNGTYPMKLKLAGIAQK